MTAQIDNGQNCPVAVEDVVAELQKTAEGRMQLELATMRVQVAKLRDEVQQNGHPDESDGELDGEPDPSVDSED
jgi:hypothetical protein